MLHAPRVTIPWIVLLLRFSSDFLEECFLAIENLGDAFVNARDTIGVPDGIYRVNIQKT
jgi:hypothetical protein